jgi:hypothetical protein
MDDDAEADAGATEVPAAAEGGEMERRIAGVDMG